MKCWNKQHLWHILGENTAHKYLFTPKKGTQEIKVKIIPMFNLMNQSFYCHHTGVWVRSHMEQGWVKSSCITEKPTPTMVTTHKGALYTACSSCQSKNLPPAQLVSSSISLSLLLIIWQGASKNLPSLCSPRLMTICLPPKSHEPPLHAQKECFNSKENATQPRATPCPEKTLNSIPLLPPISMGSPKEPITSLAMGFDHAYSIRHELPPVASKPINRVIGYFHI